MPSSTVFAKLPGDPTDAQLLRLRSDSQSMAYYADISNFMCRHIKGFHTLSVLDVGPRTGAGLGMLRLIHHPTAFTRLKLDPVEGIDPNPSFAALAALDYPDVVGGKVPLAAQQDKSFDVVICSQVVQRVEDPRALLLDLERIARKYVILQAPFQETDMISGHLSSISAGFLSSMGYLDVEVYESHHWHNGYSFLAVKSL